MILEFRKIQLINLSGVLLSIFAFIFAPWLRSQSGLGILVDLWEFLSGPNQPVDITRQRSIFALLLILTIALIGQGLSLYRAIGKRYSGWMIGEVIFCSTALGALSVLFFNFRAQTSGIIITALGVMVAGISALILSRRGRFLNSTDGLRTMSMEAQLEKQEATNLMASFQKCAADRLRTCIEKREPFSLSVIGLAHYESYATVFGDAEARLLTDALTKYVEALYPNSVSVSFSVGAVIIALPGIPDNQIFEVLEKLTQKMRQHGFSGEMLLPNGQIELIGEVVCYPKDGTGIGKLVQNALVAYGQITG